MIHHIDVYTALCCTIQNGQLHSLDFQYSQYSSSKPSHTVQHWNSKYYLISSASRRQMYKQVSWSLKERMPQCFRECQSMRRLVVEQLPNQVKQ